MGKSKAQALVLRLRTRPEVPSQVEWAVLDSDGAVSDAGICLGLAEAGAAFAARRWSDIYVLLPGETVRSFYLTLTSAERGHAHRVLPALVEEQLCEDIESLHFNLCESPDDSNTMIALAIQKSLLEQYRDTLEAVGLSPTRMIPDYLPLMDGQQDTVHIMQDNGRIIGVFGDHTGFAATTELAALALERYLAGETLGKRWRIELHCVDAEFKTIVENALRGEVPADIIVASWASPNPGDRLAHLAGRLAMLREIAPVDLLDKPYRNIGWTYAKPIIKTLAAASFLYALIWGVEGWYYHYKANTYVAEYAALYHQLFPNDKKIRNPLERLRDMQGSPAYRGIIEIHDLNRMLNDIGRAYYQVVAVPSTQNGLRVDHVDFDSREGKLRMVVHALDPSSLDQFLAYMQPRVPDQQNLHTNGHYQVIEMTFKGGQQ